VEWLGEIPSIWKAAPIKYLAIFSGGGTPSKENPAFWGGDIPWVSPKDMKSARVTSSIDKITELAVQRSATNLIDSGAVLIVVRSGILQHSIPVAINDVPVTLNQDMKALQFQGSVRAQFAMYVIAGNQKTLLLEWSKQGATVESIEHEFLANSFFPVPSLREQDVVIAFLDHETAKIDTLIEKQQQLIKLLKEKRQAVISHAVTKGLNPNVPMRDSGVEWLGEVPAHWNMVQLKKCIQEGSSISYGIVQPGDPLDEGVPFIQTTNMSSGEFDLDRLQKTTLQIASAYPRSMLHGGEVILGIRASIGAAYVVPDALKGVNLSRGVARIALGEKVDAGFLVSYLRSENVDRYWALSKQGSTFSEVSIETVRELSISVPPLEEQKEIVQHTQKKLEKFGYLIAKAEEAISLMQERRTALISAAVTGKIDVRGWQPPATAAVAAQETTP